MHNSTYLVSYTPVLKGGFKLQAYFGTAMQEFDLTVMPAYTCASHSTGHGAFLTLSTVGTSSTFTVQTRDLGLNNRTDPDDFQVCLHNICPVLRGLRPVLKAYVPSCKACVPSYKAYVSSSMAHVPACKVRLPLLTGLVSCLARRTALCALCSTRSTWLHSARNTSSGTPIQRTTPTTGCHVRWGSPVRCPGLRACRQAISLSASRLASLPM